jgi:hypothetical protein
MGRSEGTTEAKTGSGEEVLHLVPLGEDELFLLK